VIIIILYLSGNFHQLSKIEKEKAMAKITEEEGSGYHRLMSFFYKDDCQTILTVGKEIKEEYESKSKRIKRHPSGLTPRIS
jgi:hypothetical protein